MVGHAACQPSARVGCLLARARACAQAFGALLGAAALHLNPFGDDTDDWLLVPVALTLFFALRAHDAYLPPPGGWPAPAEAPAGRGGGHTVPNNWARKLAGCLRVEELRGGNPPTQPPLLPPPAAPSPATPAGDECVMLEEAEGADGADGAEGADDAWCASCELCSSYCPGCDPELSWSSYDSLWTYD